MSGFYGDFGSYEGLYDWQQEFMSGLFVPRSFTFADSVPPKPKQESFSSEPLKPNQILGNGKTHGVILIPRSTVEIHNEWQEKVNDLVSALNDDEYSTKQYVWTHYHVDGYIAYEWGSTKRFKKKYGYVHT